MLVWAKQNLILRLYSHQNCEGKWYRVVLVLRSIIKLSKSCGTSSTNFDTCGTSVKIRVSGLGTQKMVPVPNVANIILRLKEMGRSVQILIKSRRSVSYKGPWFKILRSWGHECSKWCLIHMGRLTSRIQISKKYEIETH